MFSIVSYFLVFLCLQNFCECARRNNVCKNFRDYKTIPNNRNCYHDPDRNLKVPELIIRYGYPFESHQLVSQDGFILNVFRVPHNGTNINAKRQPIILQHGIASTSKAFFLLGQESLAFTLLRNGYDVWLANTRTSEYSPQHMKYSNNDRQYWEFSFHEIGIYDLPTMIDFIVLKTGQKVDYIGHSMGSTTSYVYSSLYPDHAKSNINNIVSLAPIAFMGHIKGTTRHLIPLSSQLFDFFKTVGIYGIGENLSGPGSLFQRICSETPLIYLCSAFSLSFTGINRNELTARQLPSSIVSPQYSLKTLLHYAQLVQAKNRFQMFDYGKMGNLKIYNNTIPPEYPIEKINVPVYLFYGKNDFLSTEEDVFQLFRKLKTKKDVMEVDGISHNDFLYGKSAPDFYKLLITYLKTD